MSFLAAAITGYPNIMRVLARNGEMLCRRCYSSNAQAKAEALSKDAIQMPIIDKITDFMEKRSHTLGDFYYFFGLGGIFAGGHVLLYNRISKHEEKTGQEFRRLEDKFDKRFDNLSKEMRDLNKEIGDLKGDMKVLLVLAQQGKIVTTAAPVQYDHSEPRK